MLAEAALVISAIKTANDAFAAITKAKGNATSILAGASKFLTAKAQVEVAATQDKAKGDTSTEAFIAAIQLRRKEKELDEFFTYECEGWVAAEWQKHKKAIRDDVAEANRPAQKIMRKKVQRDDDVKTAIIGITVAAAIAVTSAVALVLTGAV